VEGVGAVFDVAGVEAGDGDSSVHGHVDGVLLSELVDHVMVEAGEGEHADLRGDVIPVVLGASGLESRLEGSSHQSHSIGHDDEVLLPHGGELFVSEDDVDNSSSVNWGVGVDGSSDLLDARVDGVTLGLRSSDDGEGSGSLSVDTEVLGERLEEHDVVSVLLEESEGVGISLEVTGGEALVSGIETGEKVLSLDDFEDSLPLLLGGINTGGVVRADVEHDEGVILACVQVFAETVEVESLGHGVEVSVGLVVVSNELSEGSVNGPGLGGNHDINVLVGVPVGEEGETESERSSSRDGLSSSDSSFLEGSGVLSESELLGLVDEGVNTLDSSVLVIHVVGENSLFGDSNAREDVRLASIVSVGSHTEEDLLLVRVLLEGVVETENGVSRGVGEGTPSGEKSVLNTKFVGVTKSSG